MRLKHELETGKIDDLYRLSIEQIQEVCGVKMGTAIWYLAQAYRDRKPVIPTDTRLEIPRGKRHLYFDFETSDEVHPTEPPHIYMIGLWDAEANRFVHFLGRGAGDEERIFRDFLNYLGDPDGICLYHWTDFETWQMRWVARRHPQISAQVEAIKRSCIDLKEIVKGALYLPVPTYSLKYVAPFMGFCWRQKDVDAFECMGIYWDYLETGDEPLIRKVLMYNEDDCKATLHVDQYVEKLFRHR
jgi:uncharacterized protein